MPSVEYPYRGGRALLNLPGHESTAAIVAEVEDSRGWKPGKDRDGKAINHVYNCAPEAKLQIANCDRSIMFTIDLHDENVHGNNLYKLDTMIQALSEFREAVADEQELFKKRHADLLAKRKKRANKKAKERREANN